MPDLLIGLTGGLGSGKSAALAELSKLGAATASADEVARRLSGPGGAVSRAVRRLFGTGYLRSDGSVDRPAVARRVFANPRARRRLERATHPSIIRGLERAVSRSRKRVAVVDAPLLFEAGLAPTFDLTVAVSAPRAAALRRVRARDGMSPAEASRRMRAQWAPPRKEAAADIVWRNAGSKSDFLKRVRQYYRAWELMTNQTTQPGRPSQMPHRRPALRGSAPPGTPLRGARLQRK